MSISNRHEIVHRKRVFYWRLYGLPPLPTASLPPPHLCELAQGLDLNFVHGLPYETFPKYILTVNNYCQGQPRPPFPPGSWW